MEYETFINQVLNLRETIEIQENNVNELESKCNNVTSSLGERVQTSRKNTRELNLVRYADATEQLRVLYEELDDLSNSISQFLVNSLSRQDATIMIYKYIYAKENAEIANIKSLSEGTIRNIISRSNQRARIKYEQLK